MAHNSISKSGSGNSQPSAIIGFETKWSFLADMMRNIEEIWA